MVSLQATADIPPRISSSLCSTKLDWDPLFLQPLPNFINCIGFALATSNLVLHPREYLSWILALTYIPTFYIPTFEAFVVFAFISGFIKIGLIVIRIFFQHINSGWSNPLVLRVEQCHCARNKSWFRSSVPHLIILKFW